MSAEHPGFMARIVGFTVSFADWAAAGFPRRDPKETRELFEMHCLGGEGEPCEEYNPNGVAIPTISPPGVCEACGCHVSGDAEELLNKVAFPNLSCPLKKWLATVDKPK